MKNNESARVYRPKPVTFQNYRTLEWHKNWVVDLNTNQFTHSPTGTVFKMAPRNPKGMAPPEPVSLNSAFSGWGIVQNAAYENARPRLVAEAKAIGEYIYAFVCMDCGLDTQEAPNQYYMVTNELWDQAHPRVFGMLCTCCLSARVGRELNAADFIECPLNSGNEFVRALRKEAEDVDTRAESSACIPNLSQ